MGFWAQWSKRLRFGTRSAIRRLRPTLVEPPAAPSANVLAISDLHLGHDLKPDAPQRPSRLDAHLAGMLDYYGAHRSGLLPWRLVIAGDAVDFIAITLTPAPSDAVPFEVTAHERRYGLAPEPAKAAWKLDRVFERHALFFDRLSAFVAQGHELVIVRGNHDGEWAFPEVQQRLRDHLTELAARRAPKRFDPQAYRSRIGFRDWFHLEPGRLYVEHGHLYDEFSASEDALAPPAGPDGAPPPRLHEPVSTLAMRYFANRHAGLDLSEVELWGFADYVRWGLSGGRFWRVLGDYIVMTARVLAFSARTSARTMARSVAALARLGRGLALEDEKLERIRAALAQVRADHGELARELRALAPPPAERSVLATAQMLYVDRLVLAAGVLLSFAGCALMPGTNLMRGALIVLITAVALGLNTLLGRTRAIDSQPKLVAAAHRVAVLFKVPLVVMGHTHRPLEQAVGGGSTYFNLGTWLGASRGKGAQAGFPHFVLDHRGAELRRWSMSGSADADEGIEVA